MSFMRTEGGPSGHEPFKTNAAHMTPGGVRLLTEQTSRPDGATTATDDVSRWAVSYTRTAHDPFGPVPKGKARLVLLTDPWSVWCWGFEPARRALEIRAPTVEFRSLVGGMFPTLPDHRATGFDVGRFFAIVQRTTGMPIVRDAAMRDRPKSTYPACVHVHTARLLDPSKEQAYLRALREAVYLDGLNVSRPEVAAEVAANVGIDVKEFEEALASGEPEREFRERLATLHTLDLHAYPTFVVTSGDRTARVEGYQSLPGILSVIESVSGRIHPLLPPPDLVDALPVGERIATRELAEILDMSVEETYEGLLAMEDKGEVSRQVHATGTTWRRAR